MTDKDYEQFTTLRDMSDAALENLNSLAVEGATASELLEEARKLVAALEKMEALEK